MKSIYLDHSATTPVRGDVFEAMLPYFSRTFGNASSIHAPGQRARKAVEEARKTVAHILGVESREIIFTSGGTESDNLAIKGVALAKKGAGNHIITTSIEHHAVLNPCQYLEDEGFKVTRLPVDGDGLVDPGSVEEAIEDGTVLVSVMLANNEVGTIQPLDDIGEITGRHGIPFHTDAVQAVGKIPVRPDDLKVDLLSVSGHKVYGPKGIGALYVRKGTSIVPQLHGGHHEMGYRPGTENVAGIVGLAKALQLSEEDREDFVEGTGHLRDILERGIQEKIPHVRLNGHPAKRLPNISNVSFRHIDGEALLLSLDLKGIALSTGSACSSGTEESSHVLKAMGVPPDVARCSLRFSLGRGTSEEDIHYVLEVLPEVVERLRQRSPRYGIA